MPSTKRRISKIERTERWGALAKFPDKLADACLSKEIHGNGKPTELQEEIPGLIKMSGLQSLLDSVHALRDLFHGGGHFSSHITVSSPARIVATPVRFVYFAASNGRTEKPGQTEKQGG